MVNPWAKFARKKVVRKALSRKRLTIHPDLTASMRLSRSDGYDRYTFPCEHHDGQ